MKSRFVRTIRWKLPRHRRSTRLLGAEEDRGRWIKCWNCGFVIDTDRSLGLGESSGISVTDRPTPNTDLSPAQGKTGIVWRYAFKMGLMLKNTDPNGTPDRDFYTLRMAEAVRGCPFCGTTNLP